MLTPSVIFDVITFFATRNCQKTRKTYELVNIEEKYLLEKMWLRIILKVRKIQGFTISLRKTFLEKPQGVGQIESPVFLMLTNLTPCFYLRIFQNTQTKLFGKSPLWRQLVFSADKHVKQDSYNYSSLRNNRVFFINGVKKLELENSVKWNKQRFWDKQRRCFCQFWQFCQVYNVRKDNKQKNNFFSSKLIIQYAYTCF